MFLFVMHRFFLAPLVLDVCFPAFQWIVVDVFTSCQFDLGIMSSACFLPCSGRTSSSAPGQRKGSAGKASVNLSKRLSNRQMAKHDACVYFHFPPSTPVTPAPFVVYHLSWSSSLWLPLVSVKLPLPSQLQLLWFGSQMTPLVLGK